MPHPDGRNDYQTYRRLVESSPSTLRDTLDLPGGSPELQRQRMEAQPQPFKEYTSAEELAEYVNVTLETFNLLAERANLRPLEVGGKEMYHRTEVKQFLSAWVSWGLARSWVTESGRKQAREAPQR